MKNIIIDKEIERRLNSIYTHDNLNSQVSNLNVACILDQFSYDCFKYECNLQYLAKNTWKEQIEKFNPDFLLIESAAGGIDGSWTGELVFLEKKDKNSIRELVEYCKSQNIPTVFWNKEDPPNYKLFIEAAKLFDYIFTTDADCISAYRRDVKHNRVYCLPFAAQPLIHNPIDIYKYKDEKYNVAFAGSWYGARHFERQVESKMLLKGAVKHNVHIYDRFFTNDDTQSDKLKFPIEFRKHIVGSLSYKEIVKAYKLYNVFLNVNIVKHSPTMFSRRVFELLASGTNIVSTYSKGIHYMFSEIIPICFTEDEVSGVLNFLLKNELIRERLAVLGIREVHEKHTYRKRLESVLEKLDLLHKIKTEKYLSIISYVKSVEELNNVIKNFNSQLWEQKELILVSNTLEGIVNKEKNISFYYCPEFTSESECLSFGIDQTKGDYLCFFTPDSYYSPYFVMDMMHASYYSQAEIIVKNTYFTYFSDNKVLFVSNPNQEYQFVHSINYKACVIKKKILEGFKSFSKDITGYLDDLILDSNIKVYSSHKYEYALVMEGSNEKRMLQSLESGNIVCFTDDFISHVKVESVFMFNQVTDEKVKASERAIQEQIYSKDYPGIKKLLIDKIPKQANVLIYGGGEHTHRLINVLKPFEFNIIGIIDKDTNKHGTMLNNIFIFGPEKIVSLNAQFIIVSSFAYEKEIVRDLNKLLHNSDVYVYPLYGENETFKNDIYTELYFSEFNPEN